MHDEVRRKKIFHENETLHEKETFREKDRLVKALDKTLRRELGPGRLLVSLGLLVLVVISALAVVDSTHRSRDRFNHLQELQRQEWALDEEWERLLLEQSTWASHDRVNQIAEQKLDMVMPDPAAIKVISGPSGAGDKP